MGDGVPDPGQVLPVLPGHPLQGGRHIVQARRPLLGARGAVADCLEHPGPGRVGRGRGESENIMKIVKCDITLMALAYCIMNTSQIQNGCTTLDCFIQVYSLFSSRVSSYSFVECQFWALNLSLRLWPGL